LGGRARRRKSFWKASRGAALNIALKQIQSFVWLAALKSFTRVAEQMNTTQPNISSRISALEEALSLRLFERDAGSVALTDQGQSLLPLAERALEAAEALLHAGNTTRETRRRSNTSCGSARRKPSRKHGFTASCGR
jgi:DNA-binding transcriptional LysR family regulator